MKKLLCLLIMIQFFVFGCSNAGGHFKDYNQAELTDKFQEAGVDPKLPTKFPVEIKEEVFNPPFEDEKVYSVDFLGTKNERFSLQIIKGGNVDYDDRLEKESVEIGKNNGLYFIIISKKTPTSRNGKDIAQ